MNKLVTPRARLSPAAQCEASLHAHRETRQSSSRCVAPRIVGSWLELKNGITFVSEIAQYRKRKILIKAVFMLLKTLPPIKCA